MKTKHKQQVEDLQAAADQRLKELEQIQVHVYYRFCGAEIEAVNAIQKCKFRGHGRKDRRQKWYDMY